MNDVKPRREIARRPPCLLISGGGHEKKGIEPENFFSRIDDSINSTQRIDPLFFLLSKKRRKRHEHLHRLHIPSSKNSRV